VKAEGKKHSLAIEGDEKEGPLITEARKNEGGSAKSKYYSVIILNIHIHCFHLIFKVQYRSFY